MAVAGGSSPLARGLRSPWSAQQRLVGIIPARAGFTRRKPRPRRRPPDHPRSRGVYETSRINVTWSYGSSPLARGLRYHRPDLRPDPRIIPARAGFTIPPPRPPPRSADHPRSRGVYHPPHHRDRLPPGSSPLARGLPMGDGAGQSFTGIIPARAGFTWRGRAPGTPARDHPRSRGVYGRSCRCGRRGSGSSPLARGLPSFILSVGSYPRIIPARAGFTP